MRAVNANSVISPRNALSYLINLGVMQAKASLENENVPAAISKIKNLQQINPSDSSMLEDLHQLLVNAGQTEEADKLFETTYKVSKATIMRFPGHGQHNNNHAWLLSRCSKKLDEALEHGNRAVQLEPENGAFLDTLAEVHFQRGDRAKAIEFSEKAVNLLDGDAQVIRQLERFKNGDPSDR
jgi:Flp pilus assembly protein TadD